jgi:probable phosphoglycerate mutase
LAPCAPGVWQELTLESVLDVLGRVLDVLAGLLELGGHLVVQSYGDILSVRKSLSTEGFPYPPTPKPDREEWLVMSDVALIRHGETEWSATGRHTSRTDLELTAAGEEQARALGSALAGHAFVAVLASPRRRAGHTADLAGLTVTSVDGDLAEWDYGEYEGITTAEIRRDRPDWSLWTDGAPGGESPEQVGARADRVLHRIRPLLANGDVALVGHGHALRVLAARWVGLSVRDGAVLALDSGSLSWLGFEHDLPVIRHWNRRAV